MKQRALLVLAAVAIAGCSETAKSPTAIRSPLLPSMAVSANGPSGAHLVTGTPAPSCSINPDLTVSCNAYEIAGVGNTNAIATLNAKYTATIDCYNPGVNPNNPIESHTTTFTAPADTVRLSPKNGRLTVPSLSVSPFSAPQVCPNPNWTPKIRAGTLAVVSYAYTVTFVGFTSPFISITGP